LNSHSKGLAPSQP